MYYFTLFTNATFYDIVILGYVLIKDYHNTNVIIQFITEY